ncbi:MAG: hypothetical protein BWY69_00748 [Planctomycetes bacterium ADurb.Bin401]|nr:MAG: hypothetical protein BWY69_00748 [Planctomycetes bacterium ADurb.Bin401]
MSISYNSFCDDFYVDMYINTRFDLPSERDTLLAFFERVKKQYPGMTILNREGTEYCLDESSQSEHNRWVSVDADRLGAGCANPESFQQAFELPMFVIGLVPYMLGVRSLDVESLDLTFGLDFEYAGNHNEIISEALFGGSAFSKLFEITGPGPLNLSPSVIVALNEDCSTRARLAIESRTEESEIQSGKFDSDKPISLFMTIRQYPQPGREFELEKVFAKICTHAVEYMDEKVVPNIVMPLTNAIAHRR